MTRNLTSLSATALGVALLLSSQGCWRSACGTGLCDGTDADSDSDSDSDADSDSESDSDTETDPCDEVPIPIYNDPARVLILLDHSSSMAGDNWDIARSAIYDLLAAFAASSLEFGLDTLPDADVGECSTSEPVIVDCGPGTEGEIGDELESMSTLVSTPLYDALESLTDPEYAPGCTDSEYAQYVLLIADGEESCSGVSNDDFVDLTNELVESGVKVIVVGFNVVWDAAQLNAIAANGGTDFTSYLVADDEPTLNAALDEIASSIDSCVFSIDSPLASTQPDLVNIYVGEDVMPMDDDCSAVWGWRWADEAHTQIELCPGACGIVMSGALGDLTATFGCQTIIE